MLRSESKLSKSKFLAGYQCPKRLWMAINKPDLASKASANQQRIFDQGHEVGELACTRFPGGTLIEDDHLHIPDALTNTTAAIQACAHVLYEPAFEYDDVLVRVDILEQLDEETWHLIEVKSSTKVKEENIQDVSIQTYVVANCGLNVAKSSLMHINRECEYPDLSNLFTLEDITDKIQSQLPLIPARVAELKAVVAEPEEPQIHVGRQCTHPYDCPFIEHCWRDIPEQSVFTIPRLAPEKQREFSDRGIIKLTDLPSGTSFTAAQQRYIDLFVNEEISIDHEEIADKLKQLEYPIHFLDFETDGPAIPRLDGTHPYQQFPYQFSCHILDEQEHLSHHEYLHEDLSDPRENLVGKLLATIGGTGSVIAYNASFEKRILLDMIATFPELSSELESIADRLWDQLLIFRSHYIDYRFGGSNSLKSVLPVIVPGMRYSELEVQDGQQSQAIWNIFIRLEKSDQKALLREELLEYCQYDSLAMVEIHRVLEKLVRLQRFFVKEEDLEISRQEQSNRIKDNNSKENQ